MESPVTLLPMNNPALALVSPHANAIRMGVARVRFAAKSGRPQDRRTPRGCVDALFFLLSKYGIGIGSIYHSPSRLLDLCPVDRQEPFGSIFPSTAQLHFRVVYELAHVITRTLSLAKQRQYRFSLDYPRANAAA
jgi:hypothetical protein